MDQPVPGEPDAGLPPAELAERAAEMHVVGLSPRQIAEQMGLGSPEEARRLVEAGRLAASRRTPEDVRADHLVLTRKILREASQTARNPGPLLDRSGNPVLDEDGLAYPNLEVRDRAHQTMGKAMEREAKLVGADAPSRNVSVGMSVDAGALREFLAGKGVTPAQIEAATLAILSGQPPALPPGGGA